MPKKKGTGKAQTPEKAKRIIKIKRRSSAVTKPATPKKTNPKVYPKMKAPKGGVFSFVDLEGTEHTLTQLEYKFADLCVGLDKTPFQCVIEAGYNVYDDEGKINKGLTWSMASENLSKPKIRAYINKQLSSIKLTKEVVMLELAQLLVQKIDNKSKTKAMDMYFKLTGEYAPEKHEHKMDQEIKEALDKVASLVK